MLPSIAKFMPYQIIQNLCSCQTSSTNFISKNIDLYIYIPEINCFAFPWAVSKVHARRDEYYVVYIHQTIRFHPGNSSFQCYAGFFALETHHRKTPDHSCWNFLYFSSQLSVFCCLIVLRKGFDAGLDAGAAGAGADDGAVAGAGVGSGAGSGG